MSDVYTDWYTLRWTYPGNMKRSAQSLFFRRGIYKAALGQGVGHIIRAPWRVLIIGSAKKELSDSIQHEGFREYKIKILVLKILYYIINIMVYFFNFIFLRLR